MSIDSRSKVGLCYLPQESSIFRKLNVEENIRAIVELHLDDNTELKIRLKVIRVTFNHSHKNSTAITLSEEKEEELKLPEH